MAEWYKLKSIESRWADFDDIKVSTKTFIIHTNMTIDIEGLYNILPVTPYSVVSKRRGRKKKDYEELSEDNIANGSIVSVKFRGDVRGMNFGKKLTLSNYFRNSVTVVMFIDNKKINFKVSKNGKFQMTGCKHDSQAEMAVKYIWEYIRPTSIYKKEGDDLKLTFVPAMRNIDFSLGFLVDRKELDIYINSETDYYSLLETSFGYTGVNIKFPVRKKIQDLMIDRYVWENGTWKSPVKIRYGDFLETLSEKEKAKAAKKDIYVTFLVFHSGKVIMSGLHEYFQRDIYYKFLDIVRESYDRIEERLLPC